MKRASSRSTILEDLSSLCELEIVKVKMMPSHQFKKGTLQKPHLSAYDKRSPGHQVETFIFLEGSGGFIPSGNIVQI